MNNHRVVSFDNELLILVDENDKEIGYMSKIDCHRGEGILHRAFSIFIFNKRGDLLIQKRSGEKALWGGYWSNSVCSHPRKGESYGESTARRLHDELGISTEPVFKFRFQYQAKFRNIGSENELCSVYTATHNGPFHVNPTEISEIKFISPEELDREMTQSPDQFTPWFKLEWEKLREEKAEFGKEKESAIDSP